MSARSILGLVSLSTMISGFVSANSFLTMMIGEINRQRQPENLVSYFGFTFPKMQQIFAEYRSLYPNGTKNIFAMVAFAFAILGLLGCAGVLGFFG
jgi:hypothetical protein